MWVSLARSLSPSCQSTLCKGLLVRTAQWFGCWKLWSLFDVVTGSEPWSAVWSVLLPFITAPILGSGIIYHWNKNKNFFFFFLTLATMTFIDSGSKTLIQCVCLHCNLQPAHAIPRFRFQLSPAASTFSWQLFWMLHPKAAPDIKSAVATHCLEHVSENFTQHVVVMLAYLTSKGNLFFMRGMIILPFWCSLYSLRVDFSM